MMKPTSDHSFPDAEVMKWKLSDQSLEIEMSNVHFDGQARGPAKLVFPLLRPPIAMCYDDGSNQWIQEPKVERLKTISGFFHKMEKHYSLHGFGSESGKRLAVGIISSEAQITW